MVIPKILLRGIWRSFILTGEVSTVGDDLVLPSDLVHHAVERQNLLEEMPCSLPPFTVVKFSIYLWIFWYEMLSPFTPKTDTHISHDILQISLFQVSTSLGYKHMNWLQVWPVMKVYPSGIWEEFVFAYTTIFIAC